jgi:hypothetical protein
VQAHFLSTARSCFVRQNLGGRGLFDCALAFRPLSEKLLVVEAMLTNSGIHVADAPQGQVSIVRVGIVEECFLWCECGIVGGCSGYVTFRRVEADFDFPDRRDRVDRDRCFLFANAHEAPVSTCRKRIFRALSSMSKASIFPIS